MTKSPSVIRSMFVLGGRVLLLPVLGGVPDHEGHEATQPVLGVGSGLGEYPDPAYLRGVAAGLGPPVLSVAIVHIGLSQAQVVPALTPSAFSEAAAMRYLPRYRSYSLLASVRAFFKGRSLSCAGDCGPASYLARISSVGL